MKLTINYKTRASKVLGLSVEDTEEYSRRVAGHLTKCGATGITKNQIIQSIFIIKDMKDRQLKERAKELHIKNINIRKYNKEILELSNLGLGCQRISNELRAKYRISISNSSIYRFLKDYNKRY